MLKTRSTKCTSTVLFKYNSEKVGRYKDSEIGNATNG